MALDEFVALERSGLRVSPLCLGVTTFGTERGWGNDEEGSRAVFDHYVESGGNFFDTADIYTSGTSERMLGKFVADKGMRDRAVIASKFSMVIDPDNPNAGGNGRKNIYCALESSLQRLGTDYFDLYWLHAWDTVTPVEEVLNTLNDLVAEGKIWYFGLSDIPAWYAARMHSIAEHEGKKRPIALQLAYSLIERNIEREHVPAAKEMGWGICASSPLQGGLLTGKYMTGERSPNWRLEQQKNNPILNRPPVRSAVTRSEDIVELTVRLAGELGVSPAQLALAWVMAQPGMTSPIVGARKIEQLVDNLGALEVMLTDEMKRQLDEAGAIDLVQSYTFFQPPWFNVVNGNKKITGWR